MKIILIILATSFSLYVSAQETILFELDEIEKSKFLPWNHNAINELRGTYDFGLSESEWQLEVFFCDSVFSIQREFSKWKPSVNWFELYKETFNNLTLKGNKLYNRDGRLIVEFLIFNNKEKSFNFAHLEDYVKGAVFYGKEEIEFGEYQKEIFKEGKLGLLSVKLIEKADLNGYDAFELKIMRNEIFARYGHIFKEGDEMEIHFKKQGWYSPKYEDVKHLLTNVELRNIETILKLEEVLKKKSKN